MTPRKPKRSKQLGVSDAEYARLLAAQGGTCALCPNTPKTRRLHVDHDHVTGRVRGLLCYVCNKYLPASRDAAWHRRAAAYLEGDTPLTRRHKLPGDLVTKPLVAIGGEAGQVAEYARTQKRGAA